MQKPVNLFAKMPNYLRNISLPFEKNSFALCVNSWHFSKYGITLVLCVPKWQSSRKFWSVASFSFPCNIICVAQTHYYCKMFIHTL